MKKSPFFDRKYLSSVAVGVLSFVLAATAVVYIGYHMSSSVKEGVDVFYATSGRIPLNVVCDGYILRDESVIDGVPAGVLTPTVADGEKVRSGNKVADIYSSSSAATQSKISLVEDQISFYEKCASSHISVGDTSLVDRSLADSVLAIRRAVEGGKVTAALSMKSDTVLDIRRLGVLSGRVTDYDAVITSLKSELATLKASMGSVSSSVFAPYSGYYFSVTDGYEDIFSVSDIDALTYSGFFEMVSAAENRAVTESLTQGKLVRDFRWYVACPMSTAEASSMTEGKSYSVTLENNADETLSMELCTVLSNASDAVAVFRCSRIPDSYDFTRCQKTTIEIESFTGFRIPAEAVRFHEGMQGVFIRDEVTVKFRRISVAYESGGYFYCNVVDDTDAELPTETDSESTEQDKPYYSYLRENDIVIRSGTGLYVGMTLDLK